MVVATLYAILTDGAMSAPRRPIDIARCAILQLVRVFP